MKNKIIELRKEGKSYNEICKLIGCAKSTISYHCKKIGIGNKEKIKISDDTIEKIKDLYIHHITKKELSEKFNVSEYEIKKYIKGLKRYSNFSDNLSKKQKQVISVTERRKKLKQLSIEYKGGKCSKCGYMKCISALEFHHMDPNEKDFGIGQDGHTRSWKRIKEELDKCILVCANCHREIHYDLNLGL